MSRLAWSQLRYRAARSAALLLGMLVAVTAFCVLTASARTSQLRTVGTVRAHFRAVAVADVVALSIRERSAEFATLRALGWPESALGRVVIGEALLIGAAGSVTGAAAGLAATAEFTGQVPLRLLLAALASVLAAAAVTTGAAIVPAQMLRRLPTAQLLAEE